MIWIILMNALNTWSIKIYDNIIMVVGCNPPNKFMYNYKYASQTLASIINI